MSLSPWRERSAVDDYPSTDYKYHSPSSRSSAFNRLQQFWAEHLVARARRSELIKRQAGSGWVCTIMDDEIEQDRAAAVVRAFVLACTALRNAAGHGFATASEPSRAYVHVTVHSGGANAEGGPAPTRVALDFLMRKSPTATEMRLADPDAVVSVIRVLAGELPGTRPTTVARARAEVLSAIAEREADYLGGVTQCVTPSPTPDRIADAYSAWLGLQPMVPPGLESRHSDLAYALLKGLDTAYRGLSRSERTTFFERLLPVLPRLSKEADRLREMSDGLDNMVGREYSRLTEMRRATSALRSLIWNLQRHELLGPGEEPAATEPDLDENGQVELGL